MRPIASEDGCDRCLKLLCHEVRSWVVGNVLLQNHYRRMGRVVLACKTVRFAFPNGPFYTAKRPVL